MSPVYLQGSQQIRVIKISLFFSTCLKKLFGITVGASHALVIKIGLELQVSWICSVEVGKKTCNKIRGFEPGRGRMFLRSFFVY